MSAATILVDLGAETFQMALGAAFVEIALERQENGALTDASRGRIVAALREHSQSNGSMGRPRALCAIGARGVSLRRLMLPDAPREKLPDLVRLQIESEFPTPPEELAWGWRIVGPVNGPAGKQQDVLVAAIRRTALEESAELFVAAGVAVSFTVGALARMDLAEAPTPDCALLDLGRRQSEWLSISGSAPSGLRALAWGNETLAEARLPRIPGGKVYLTGAGARSVAAAARLSCEALETGGMGPRSATILGLERLARKDAGRPPLLLQSGDVKNGGGFRLPRQWTALAAALAAGVLLFPFLEALVFKPHLTSRLGQIHVDETRLATMDRELSFFQYLRKSEPPYLDVFNLIAQAAPQGTSFESYSLTRRGELSLRGKMAGGTQVTDLRSKLIDSGWFSAVVVDEQTALPDRRVTVRLTAQLKAADARRALPEETKPKNLDHG